MRSRYFESLYNNAGRRYKEKIEVIGGKDPYTLERDAFSSEIEDFPAVRYPDIVHYLIFAPSPMRKNELKNFKSLDAHNHFVCEWVREVKVHSIPGKKISVILGRVGLVVCLPIRTYHCL